MDLQQGTITNSTLKLSEGCSSWVGSVGKVFLSAASKEGPIQIHKYVGLPEIQTALADSSPFRSYPRIPWGSLHASLLYYVICTVVYMLFDLIGPYISYYIYTLYICKSACQSYYTYQFGFRNPKHRTFEATTPRTLRRDTETELFNGHRNRFPGK